MKGVRVTCPVPVVPPPLALSLPADLPPLPRASVAVATAANDGDDDHGGSTLQGERKLPSLACTKKLSANANVPFSSSRLQVT